MLRTHRKPGATGCAGRNVTTRLDAQPCVHSAIMVALLVTLVGLTPVGCRRGGMGRDNQSTSEDTQATLRERAETLWSAKVAEDCKTVFQFESLRGAQGVTEEAFCDYFRAEEPFRVHACTVGEVLVEDNIGWVQLDVTTSMRRFPSATPVTSERWEKWRFVDTSAGLADTGSSGEAESEVRVEDGSAPDSPAEADLRASGMQVWMPVPPKELDAYPDAPPLRDAVAETELRARFEESWQARLDKDWTQLYEFIDPRDREQIDATVFADTHAMFEYLSCNVHWVQVEGDGGVVRVTVHHKLNDPSLTKLPPRDATVREEWVRYEGTWYLDVKRAA